ncbi:hypothetical protein [Thorsellia kenyensis]|uniref:Lipoprotein n=1 Tax=Thorsellia kenyensis TaxID=1549888 RepID=A0ABV6C8P6_9GAMM
MTRKYKKLSLAFLSVLSACSPLYIYANIKQTPSVVEERIKVTNEKKEDNLNFIQMFTNLHSNTDPNVFLNAIELSPYSTRVQLTIDPINPSGAYCLWDVNDPSAYRLIDVDTNKIYFLEKQVSPIKSCNQNEWYQLFRNEVAEIQLFFPALGEEVKNIQLIEGVAGDEQTSAQFSVVQLERTSKSN